MEVVEYKNFNIATIPDNEAGYFNLLQVAIQSVDDFYYLSISKAPKAYNIRISLTQTGLVDSLISQINNLNNALKLKVEWSKSSKSGNIYFKINL